MTKFLFATVLVFITTCNSNQNNTTVENRQNIIEYEGEFRSLKGVMNNLSCYCYNGGHLTLDSGEKINLCFEDENTDIQCQRIKVSGYYKTLTNHPEPTSPCPKGEKEVLMVESYECL